MKKIIAISGKKQSGKDTVGEIIENLLNGHTYSSEEDSWNKDTHLNSCFQKVKIFKFANKVKQMVSVILNCTLEDLEDEKFKNTEIPELSKYCIISPKIPLTSKMFKTKEEGVNYLIDRTDFTKEQIEVLNLIIEVRMTPRKLLQLVGVEFGRNLIHQDIWVNSTLNEIKNSNADVAVITDLRFKNELEKLQELQTVFIRVNRKSDEKNTHISETDLDTVNFKHIINNNKSYKDLVEQVKNILIKENIYGI